MVRPAALYNKARFSRDFMFLGRVVAVMCGNRNIKREELSDAELSALEEIENENEEMEKNLEKAKVAKARYRAAKAAKAKSGEPAPAAQDEEGENRPQLSEGQTKTSEDNPTCPQLSEGQTKTSEDNEGQDGLSSPVLGCHRLSSPNKQTNNTTNTTNTTSTTNTNRSVPVPVRARKGDGTNGNGNGNGTAEISVLPGGAQEARRRVAEFARAAKADHGAFFDPAYDAVTAVIAVTGDIKSAKRWRQLVSAKGESAIREETFRFWRELGAGEDVDNRGAALNARLAALPDEAGEDDE